MIDKSVKQFKKRRYSRLISRMDAEDEGQWITTENGHRVHLSENGIPDLGNRHVIEKMMSGGNTRTVKRQKIQTVAMPTEFKKGPGKKALTSFNKYLEGVDVEAHISDLLASSQDIINNRSQEVFASSSGLKITKSEIGERLRVRVYNNHAPEDVRGKVAEVVLKVPDLDAVPDEYRWCEAGSFSHEWMHYMNMCASNGTGYSSYTDASNDLNEAIKNSGLSVNTISDNVKQALAEYKSAAEKRLNESVKKYDAKCQNVLNAYHKGLMSADEGNKLLKKLRKEAILEGDRIRSSVNDGAVTLSNLYDALMFGNGVNSGLCYVGHGKSYFKGNINRVKDEALSIYVQMQFNKDNRYLKLFREDQPEIAKALDDCIDDMLNSRR